jgi:hypothetical protein
MNKQQLIDDFDAYFKKIGKPYSSWYAGIAADREKRLFNDHNVDKENGSWIHAPADTADVAREVEKILHGAGCKGGPGGGDYSTKGIYAYVITAQTVE